MNTLSPFLLFSLLFCSAAGNAQRTSNKADFKNEVRLNLFSLALKTVSVQYERSLRPHLTLAFGLRGSPEASLPLQRQLGISSNSSGNGNVVLEALGATRVRNFALTPEVRYYFRRNGEARGLYGALFARYSTIALTSNFRAQSNSASSGLRNVDVAGRFGAGSVGVMLGAKFRLSNTITLDWWIAGPMYTSGTIRLNVDVDDAPLTQEDQDLIQQDADRGIRIGPLDLEKGSINFRQNGFDIKVPLNYGEVRTGLAIGIRF